jgi:UDP-2-acetamido-3-amino-2,3-dideoxy-glucuronate N-acetyltransferase
MMDRNIAVIGCGYWGKNLVRNFAELGALHTMCDADPAVLSDLAARYSDARTETDYKRVLQDSSVRGVVIATPAVSHYVLAREALLAGKDVLVEKPLALIVEEGQALIDLAAARDRILMVGHLLEYHPAVTKLKQLVDGGELGNIRYVYSNRLNLGKFRTEENILWSFAPHDISAILLLLGGELPIEVCSHGGSYLNHGIADVTVTNLIFKSGVRGHIFVSWLHPFKEQKLVVVGGRKMAVFDDTVPRQKLVTYSHDIDWVGRKPVPRRKEAENIDLPPDEPLKIECQDFVDCVRTRRTPKVDGRKGLQVLQVLSACQRSLERDGEPVSLHSAFSSGGDFFVHETSLVEKPCQIGDGTKIWHFSHLMPNVTVGRNCVIGQNVFIAKGVRIGNNVKIENNVSVFEGVTLEDNVFCGPSCVFTNVMNPRSHVSRKQEYRPTLVKEGATIGANATIVCGNTTGRYAFIGAGSVVTSDLPDHSLAYGNPARVRGWVCECGEKLDFGQDATASCHRCGKTYQQKGKNEILPLY